MVTTEWKNGWKPSDVVVIVILFLIIYAVAISAGVKEKKDQKGKRHKKSGVDFFLGGRDMNWALIGVSIAASNIGTDVLVALTGSVCSSGLGGMSYEIGSGWSILCLGFFMGPMYLRSVLKTIPQYMEMRYNKYCRIIFVLFSVAVFILSKMGVNVYSGALIFQTMIDTGERQLSLWCFIPVIVVITALYTVVGGLTSVMWADLVQMGIFMISGFASVGFCLKFFGHKLGNLIAALDGEGLQRLHHLILPITNPDYPWPATTLGLLVHEYYYWSADQEMAQRVISAKGLGDARIGCALGATLKVACFFISVVPGWSSRIFYEQCLKGQGHLNWCGPNVLGRDYDMRNGGDANRAYPLLVMREFPQGFKGIMVAGFLAAIMSNLSGAINSLSTIMTYDIYNRFFPPKAKMVNGVNIAPKDHGQRTLVFVGRVTVIMASGITLLWQLGIQNLGSINLFALTLNIQQHFGGSIAATLLIGSCWRRSTQWGGLAGLLTGGIFAIIHVAMALHYYPKCQTFISSDKSYVVYPSNFYIFSCLHSSLATCLIWGITIATNIIVSFATPKPDYSKIEVYCIQWEDLIPRYIVWIRPKRAKESLDTGYVDALRQQALVAQQEVDKEFEDKKRSGHKDTEKNNSSKTDLVDPIVDDDILEKVKADQKRKMYAADFCAIAAFFFTLFMYIYFR